MIDILGELLWYLSFTTPLITIPIIWKISNQKKIIKIIIGLLAAILLSFLFYAICLIILFRDGLDPG